MLYSCASEKGDGLGGLDLRFWVEMFELGLFPFKASKFKGIKRHIWALVCSIYSVLIFSLFYDRCKWYR